MMDGLVMPLEMNSPLKTALEVFKTTGFAFVLIVAKSDDMDEGDSLRIAASLAIRDILPLIAKANLSIPAKELASQLVSVSGKTSIRNTLDYMLNKGIRNIGINEEPTYRVGSRTAGGDERNKNHKLYDIINDRKILEFLLSHNGREVLCRKGVITLTDIGFIDNLNTSTTVNSNTTISDGAGLLMDVRNPFLIYESNENEGKEYRYIITPWDIVMKALKSADVTGGPTTHEDL
jgi:hypothetical protein